LLQLTSSFANSVAQIGRSGNINTTVIGGTYNAAQVRLPRAAGSREIATAAHAGSPSSCNEPSGFDFHMYTICTP
jgi:hypothetical protein